MSAKMESLIKDLSAVIKTPAKETTPYDTQATVTRVLEDTAYVHIPGGVAETPCSKTIACKVGDTVQVRVGGGKAWLVGNASAPPTDDTTANTAIKRTAKLGDSLTKLQRIAGNTDQYFWHVETGEDTGSHITEIPKERFLSAPATGGYNLLMRNNGIAIRNGLIELASYGTTIILGRSGYSRLNVQPTGINMVNSVDTEIFAIKPDQTQTGWKNVDVVTYATGTSVIATSYFKSDTSITNTGTPYTELTINGNRYPFSTGITTTATAGSGVRVTISSAGAEAIRNEMVQSESYAVSTDTTVDSSKTYYELVDSVYVEVTPVGTENPSTEGWYEKSVTYYSCVLSVVYMVGDVISADMTLKGHIQLDSAGYMVDLVNTEWSSNSGTDTMMRTLNQATGISTSFGVGSGGYNHGVWSSALNHWMIYTDQSGTVKIPKTLNVTGSIWTTSGGEALVGVKSGAGRLYMYSQAGSSGNRGLYGSNASGTFQSIMYVGQNGYVYFPNVVTHYYNLYVQNSSGAAVHAITGSYNVALHSNPLGTRGVYDSTGSAWIIYRNSSNQTHIPLDLFLDNGALHLGTGYGTNLHVSCVWSDGDWHDIITRNGSSNDVYVGGSKDIDGITTRTFIRGDTIKLNDASGASISSDRNIKKDIATYDSKYDAFYDALNPVTYKFINGKSGRTHSGFISQDVRDALLSSGLSAEDFGGYVKDELTYRETDTDGSDFETSDVNYLLDHGINEIHQLIYQEFIALNTWQIQKLKARVAELEAIVNG